MMKLHWGPMSPFVRKVMIAAHELGIADRIQPVRSLVAMNQTNPAVMADNPLSKIPTLVTDDGTPLYDSDVICEYLDSLCNGGLFPPAGAERWTVLRWNALASGLLDALVLWRNERLRPDGHRSLPTLEAYAQKTAATLDTIEREIEAFARLRFSIGHIALGCAFGYLDLRFGDLDWRTGHPTSARWMAQFMQRPSAQATQADVADRQVPPMPSGGSRS
jgi:glutathione S-transferase